MRNRFILASICLLALSVQASAQRASDFQELCDSLSVRALEHFNVKSRLNVSKTMKRGNSLDLYFSNTMSDYPWHDRDLKWLKDELKEGWPKSASNFNLGEIFCNGVNINDLITPEIGNKGGFKPYKFKMADKRGTPTVEKVGGRKYVKGLHGRHIVLWQSHGRYYNNELGMWKWQRATVHRTVEDLYTQSYVLPFLIPMLENAGAYVMTPRERDTQVHEIISDNDPAFAGERDPLLRQKGRYSETGSWSNAGTGFADALREYDINDNPFTMGSARKTECATNANARARWSADVTERGRYAVYVSYKTIPESTNAAYYTVRHLGGTTEFKVNQQRGGGTWMYLGSFEFSPECEGYVELDNRGSKGSYVTADAVKIGGGMGKISREGTTSGMPSYCEGASYWMPWAGADSTLRQWETDYTNDYATRGAWTEMMKTEKKIPFDLSLAFHTDAGTTPDDSIIGTLAIYTLKCDGRRKFKDGNDRMAGRLLTDYVQTQIVDDIRADFEPQWQRRQLWDRSYSESRTTDVPAILLELLSHQNFSDMKYGLDPSFRFTVSRAIYKGMLKFLSELYGCSYVVQPLPPHALSVRFSGNDKAELSWKETTDEKEPTADSKSFIVYTRIDGGAFDEGKEVRGNSVQLPVENGHIYSYKVTAVNDGGESFPTEILSIGRPSEGTAGTVLVVNNFTRVGAPAWIDSPEYAGFNGRIDTGVPYINEINYIGENYEFRRSLQWQTDDNPGFGASYMDHCGEIIAGNSFDYPYVHGKALLAAGKAFYSMSSEAFCNADEDASVLDLICGKQITTMLGAGRVPERFKVFPVELQDALRRFTSVGGNIFISGSNIATDAWDQIYPFEMNKEEMESTQNFIMDVLGYKLASSFGTASGRIGRYDFYNSVNPDCYCIECPDGLTGANRNGRVWIRYDKSGVPGGVQFKGNGYKVVSIGVPLECIKSESDRNEIIKSALNYIEK